MSDAGYEGWLRTQQTAPSVARTCECRIALKCPHCDFLATVTVTAETAPSDGFECAHKCESCEREFFVDAVMDIEVRTQSNEW